MHGKMKGAVDVAPFFPPNPPRPNAKRDNTNRKCGKILLLLPHISRGHHPRVKYYGRNARRWSSRVELDVASMDGKSCNSKVGVVG